MKADLLAPFPWFGGKRKVAPIVWPRFGEVTNYVEPFFGSGAVLLGAPWPSTRTETVNDLDGFVSNFWRATSYDPDQVAHYADWPVNENDQHARHVWLRARREALSRRLEGDPEYYDAKIAGWWVWGACVWIGGGWCDPATTGPWVVEQDEEGIDVLVNRPGKKGQRRQRVHLGNAGMGVNRKNVHLGNAGNGDPGTGARGLLAWMQALRDRLRRVRVCCGDWERICGRAPTYRQGPTAVFLDPPYDQSIRCAGLYSQDTNGLSARVREWCLANGDNPLLRIALCGYEGEHDMPESWECVAWKTKGGYGNQSKMHDNPNARRERVWFSPHCLSVKEKHEGLFALLEGEE